MFNRYRIRFILSNMGLCGGVLLITFIILGAATYQNGYRELENTMNIMLESRNKTDNIPIASDEMPHERFQNEPPPLNDGYDKIHKVSTFKGFTSSMFTAVIYDIESGELTYISYNSDIDSENVKEACEKLIKTPNHFGKLTEYGLFYCRSDIHREYKFAFADSDAVTRVVLSNILVYVLLFFVIMGFIFFISIKLSYTAVKPLEQAVEMERNFVADISHDLKTPITIVLTNNSILKSNPDISESERLQWINSTDEAAKSMLNLVTQMLTLSSLEALEKTVELKNVSLSSFAEKCILQLESLAFEQNITVVDDIAQDVVVKGTDEYIEKICTGLIENAIKYEEPGGTISVKVYINKKTPVFSVTNKGSRISEEDLPHIFERFYRGDKSRSQHKGFGLGLPIIKQITDMIEADISVSSSEEYGTRFIVKFSV